MAPPRRSGAAFTLRVIAARFVARGVALVMWPVEFNIHISGQAQKTDGMAVVGGAERRQKEQVGP